MTGNEAGHSAREQARLRREKIQRLERSATAWEAGATGEQATGQVLAQLDPAAWTTWHDVRWPGRQRANIDHVVVGPPGVFVIDSKNWSGTVAITNNVLRQNGRSRETAIVGVAEAGLAVLQIVPDVPIHPVLCLVREEPVTGWVRDVMVCSTGNLDAMVQSRPQVLSAEQVQATAAWLEAGLSEGQRAATQPRRTSNRQSRSRSGARSLIKLHMAGLLALVLIAGLQAGVLTAAAQWFGEQFVSVIADDPEEEQTEGPSPERKKKDRPAKSRSGGG